MLESTHEQRHQGDTSGDTSDETSEYRTPVCALGLLFTALKCVETSFGVCVCECERSALSASAASDACCVRSLISFKAPSHTIIQFSLPDNDHVILIWQVDYAASHSRQLAPRKLRRPALLQGWTGGCRLPLPLMSPLTGFCP